MIIKAKPLLIAAFIVFVIFLVLTVTHPLTWWTLVAWLFSPFLTLIAYNLISGGMLHGGYND